MTLAPKAPIRLVMTGIEGQLINTAPLNFEKWQLVALDSGFSEGMYQHLWQRELVGLGDRAIFDVLRSRAPRERFPSRREARAITNSYYKRHLNSAKIPDGLAEAIPALRRANVRLLIVTHAPRDYAQMQFDFIKAKTGLTFDENDMIWGHRKDLDAYVIALGHANDTRPFKTPEIRPENTLVIEDSESYRERAAELHMNVANLALNLPEGITPQIPSRFPTLDWMGVVRSVLTSKKPAPRGDDSFLKL